MPDKPLSTTRNIVTTLREGQTFTIAGQRVRIMAVKPNRVTFGFLDATGKAWDCERLVLVEVEASVLTPSTDKVR